MNDGLQSLAPIDQTEGQQYSPVMKRKETIAQYIRLRLEIGHAMFDQFYLVAGDIINGNKKCNGPLIHHYDLHRVLRYFTNDDLLQERRLFQDRVKNGHKGLPQLT